MLIKKNQTENIKISENMIIKDYNLNTKNIGIAVVEINERYPKEGFTLNKECQEIYYVIKGTGEIFIDNKTFKLEEGDVFLIDKNKKYYLIGNNLKIICPTIPAWTEEQHVNIKN